MLRKRHLHQWKHQFDDAYPFEALLSNSWQAVEFIKIESGTMTLKFKENHHMTLDKGLFSDVRIKSRKATLSDCSDFLRPGVDICALLSSQCSDNSNESSANHVWHDAKINSIERKPHNSDSECSCLYYVNFYIEQGSLGSEIRTLSKDVKVVRINEIAILQKLERNSIDKNANPPKLEGNNIVKQPYRWESCEDCSTVLHTKLILGKFLSDLTWLVVTSVMKRVPFCVRSVKNKIVYQILGRDGATNSSSNTGSHNIISVVNFEVDKKGTLEAVVCQVDVSDTNTSSHHAHDSSNDDDKVSTLRRSKRRNIQPERYVGGNGGNDSEIKVSKFRTWPYKYKKMENGEESSSESEENGDNSKKVNEVSSCKKIQVCHRRRRNKKNGVKKSSEEDQNEDQTQLYDVPVYEVGDLLAPKHHHLNVRVTKGKATKGKAKANQDEDEAGLINVPVFEKSDGLALEHHHLNVRVERSKVKAHNKKYKLQRKSLCDLEDDMDFGLGSFGMKSNKGFGEKRHRSGYSRSKSYDHDAEQANKGKRSNAYTNKKMIDSYLKEDINRKPNEEEAPMMDKGKEISNLKQKKEEETPQSKEQEKMSEIEKLWAEMEMALTSSRLEEEAEESNVANLAEPVEEPRYTCPHDYVYDEQIGICCYKCGDVKTEIQYVTAPFREPRRSRRNQEENHSSGEESDPKADEEDDLNLFSTQASRDEVMPVADDNVWGLIPEPREKMHDHQMKAFEFLWQNIGGSMKPSLMESKSKEIGGCVISHAPGAGKTFLIIAFLSSYLKLFPGKKPLVLAPKTTLHTWYKEFIKWDISVPVYFIHGRGHHTDFDQNSIALPGVPNPNEDVKHVLDCLDKIKKWQAHPSVLVMSYNKFSGLIRQDFEFVHRKYMSKALREGPGILILDEGHNPRSTKSRLRKGLMKVETDLRILLSGTLFQNNFGEYFNTLCLARPKFIDEVLDELDTIQRRKGKRVEKARHLLESRARKLFLDNIAKKIDSNERMHGLHMLREITNDFIDFYEGGNFESVPGLQIYTLLMNTTNMQREILQKLEAKMVESISYPLELELLITLGSIHPWLVQTATCASKFFTLEQLSKLEECKYDVKIGTKVKFVLSLVFRVMEREKVLIFCHNLAPVKLLIELFEMIFKWKFDEEILSLNGELELLERGRVIDKFEDPRGPSKVLFASITACAEGISLTAASRVIFLDSEWNPSKTKQAIARAFRPGQQKMVYVYQLLATGTLEEDKNRRTTWKEWVSNMIFSEAFVENPLHSQAEKIEDDVLREMVETDKSKSIHMILKNENASKRD